MKTEILLGYEQKTGEEIYIKLKISSKIEDAL
jgi:hypothetical protein